MASGLNVSALRWVKKLKLISTSALSDLNPTQMAYP